MAMSNAERQARWRVRRAAEIKELRERSCNDAPPEPPLRNDARKLSRPKRWAAACAAARNAIADLQQLQEEYDMWTVPPGLEATALGEKLDAVRDLDLQAILDAIDEADNLDLPRGFGRD